MKSFTMEFCAWLWVKGFILVGSFCFSKVVVFLSLRCTNYLQFHVMALEWFLNLMINRWILFDFSSSHIRGKFSAETSVDSLVRDDETKNMMKTRKKRLTRKCWSPRIIIKRKIIKDIKVELEMFLINLYRERNPISVRL